MSDSGRLAVQLWSIGDEVRISILNHLPFEGGCDGGINVTELSEKLGVSQPTISHHLRVLRQAGIVKKSKKCRDCYYYIDEEEGKFVLENLKNLITQN